MLAWPPQSLDVTPIDFLMWGHVKEHLYAVPPRTVDDLVARLPAADTAVDTNILRHLEECHAAHCLLSCNRRKPLQTPTVITRHLASFDGNMYLENLTPPICCINFARIFLHEITLCRSCAGITPHPVNITSD